MREISRKIQKFVKGRDWREYMSMSWIDGGGELRGFACPKACTKHCRISYTKGMQRADCRINSELHCYSLQGFYSNATNI